MSVSQQRPKFEVYNDVVVHIEYCFFFPVTNLKVVRKKEGNRAA